MIQWLTTIKSAKDISYLSRHYVLLSGNRFFVLTSKTLNGVPCHIISESNVEQQPKQQILVENPFTVDPNRMNFRTTDKGLIYQKTFKSVLQPFTEKLDKFSFTEKIEKES